MFTQRWTNHANSKIISSDPGATLLGDARSPVVRAGEEAVDIRRVTDFS